jgi:hypothetical protein
MQPARRRHANRLFSIRTQKAASKEALDKIISD